MEKVPDIKIPLMPATIEEIQAKKEILITLDDKIYTYISVLVYSENKSIIKIGENITLDTTNGVLNYKIRGNIEDQIKDMSFIENCYTAKNFKINGTSYPVPIKTEKIHCEFKCYLQFLHKINELLKILNIESNILKLDMIDTASKVNFSILYQALIKKETIKKCDLKFSHIGVGFFEFANLNICVDIKEASKFEYRIELSQII